VRSSTEGRVQEEEYDMAILATGPFHGINFPDEFRAFTGPLMHSAHFDRNIPLENRVVGVVGSSASACQVITAIEPLVKELVSYQRSAPYITPRFQSELPSWLRFLFRWVPGFLRLLLALLWLVLELVAICCTSGGNWMSSLVGWVLITWMKLHVKDPTLRKSLTPDYKFGVRRPIVSDTFFKAMSRKHVRLESSLIRKVEGTEIVTEDGKRQELDVRLELGFIY